MQEPVFETIKINRRQKNITERIEIFKDVELESEEIKKVISLNAWATAHDSQVEGDKLKVNGKIVFYLCYENTQGEIEKKEFNQEICEYIQKEDICSVCTYDVSFFVDKESIEIFEGKARLSTIITILAEGTITEEINAVSEGDGLIVNKKQMDLLVAKGQKKTSYPIEEEFELNYPVKQVVSQKVVASVTSVQAGVGCIIVDGEVILSALLLQNIEKSDIMRESKIFPFRLEIECDDAMPTMLAEAKVKVKSFKTDIAVDGDNGKSSVNLTVVLFGEGQVYEEKQVLFTVDAFNLTENIESTYCTCETCMPSSVCSQTRTVSGRADMKDLTAGIRLMSCGNEKAEILSVENDNLGIRVIGTVTAKAYFRDVEGKNFAVKLEIPFEEMLDCDVKPNTSFDVYVCIKNISARLVSLAETEIEAKLTFSVYSNQKQSLKYLKEIKACGEKCICDSAISVYIAMENEELWSLAKRLNVMPEVLVETNKDLKFPLTGKERIVVYRQK